MIESKYIIPYINKTIFWSHKTNKLYPLLSLLIKNDVLFLSDGNKRFQSKNCSILLHTTLDKSTGFGLEMTKILEDVNWDYRDLLVKDYQKLIDEKFDIFNLIEDNQGSIIDFKWLKRLKEIESYKVCLELKKNNYSIISNSYYKFGKLFFSDEKKNWNNDTDKVTAVTKIENFDWTLSTKTLYKSSKVFNLSKKEKYETN